MAFKVKATMVEFLGDEKRFPCHFRYRKGDYFVYDGEEFHGRICPGVLNRMGPTLIAIRTAGTRYAENVAFRYSGLSARDESMAKYDGLGFRPLKEPPAGCEPQHLVGQHPVQLWEQKRPGGYYFPCADARTSAFFYVEPIDICSRGYDLPYYRRSMAMLEKVKTEPGLTLDGILAKFTEWEQTEIYPPLNRVVAEILLDEMGQVNYLEKRDGKYYPLERAMNTEAASATGTKL